ncbi:ATP-dependent nuclease [Cetobacterium sp.]|uniref:ATP-dependent nuclease n=1 Tax=Cetobacterium sp. TaxID=2071632 RepID=UPI0025C724BE|nr:TOPRIM nucleotidyl transferase/hydrolase domain-containing protein [Cetobacterium sp.]
MNFKELYIENFRNFKEIKLEKLTQKNIVFGENDIGKTNLIHALRLLFDWKIRKEQCLESDFHRRDTTNTIVIRVLLDLSDSDNEDNKKIFAKIKGLLKADEKDLFLELTANYNSESLCGEITLKWGPSIEQLVDIPQKFQRYEIDDIFNPVYIDSSIKLEEVFKRYLKKKINKSNAINDDELCLLNTNIDNLNNHIGSLKVVTTIADELSVEYNNYKLENMNIKIKSEIEIDNIYSKLNPYIEFEDKTYPTCGDGRKKIMEYSLLTLLAKEDEEKKINIFFIEEVENHLHRSVQLSISKQLFQDQLFKYMFLSTHSSFLIKKIENATLIKLISDGNIIGKSVYYKIPDEYQYLKNKMTDDLTEAIFAKKVLLVEGPSEKQLFDKVLSTLNKDYETENKIIISVNGVDFKPYYDILNKLGIDVIIKTDNDISIYKNSTTNYPYGRASCIGINRCLNIIEVLSEKDLKFLSIDDQNLFNIIKSKEYLYSKYDVFFKSHNIYLSKIDLENDLMDILTQYSKKLKDELEISEETIVEFLQKAKVKNMIKFLEKIKEVQCREIYDSDKFECLKKLCDE